MTAALYALRNNKSVLILEKEAFGGQIATSPRLENYPTIESISGSEWADRLFEQVTNLGAEFELEEVESIEKVDNVFHIKTNYAEHEALAVIVANGVKPRKMGLPNEDDLVGKGVSYCAVCDGPFYKHSRPVLVAKPDLDSRCIRRLQKPSRASLTNHNRYDTFMRHSINAPMLPSV